MNEEKTNMSYYEKNAFYCGDYTRKKFTDYIEKIMERRNLAVSITRFNKYLDKLEETIEKLSVAEYNWCWIEWDEWTHVKFLFGDLIDKDDLTIIKKQLTGFCDFNCISYDDGAKSVVYAFTVKEKYNFVNWMVSK